MFDTSTDPDAGRLLAGRWIVAGSSRGWWTRPAHRRELECELLGRTPLRVRWVARLSALDGTQDSREGSGVFDGDELLWHRRGLRRVLPGRARVLGADEEARLLMLEHEASRISSPGIDVLQRLDAAADARAVVAVQAQRFGIGLEQFARLTWFEPA